MKFQKVTLFLVCVCFSSTKSYSTGILQVLLVTVNNTESDVDMFFHLKVFKVITNLTCSQKKKQSNALLL